MSTTDQRAASNEAHKRWREKKLATDPDLRRREAEQARAYRAKDPAETKRRRNEWYGKNKDKRAAYARAWRQKYRERVKKVDANSRLKRLYGITLEQLEAAKIASGHGCYICGEVKLLHVDHDHSTGEVRGLLCFSCNAGLGKFKDSPALLRKSAAYLENQ